MTVSNLSTNLNSSANSGSQQMGTSALAKSISLNKPLSSTSTGSKSAAGVDVSISSKAIAAYQASLRSANASALTLDQIKAFTDKQLTLTPLAQFKALSAAQLAAIPVAAVKGLTSEQLRSLSPEQIIGLSAVQIAALDKTHISKIDPTSIQALTNTQLSAITPMAFSGMTQEQLLAITPMQGIALKASKLTYLNDAQKAVIQSKMVMAGPPQNLMQIMAAQSQR